MGWGEVMISEHVRTHGHVMVFPDESMTMTKSHRCELAITHLPLSLKSQNLALGLPADKCEWDVTSHHLKANILQ